MNLIVKHKYKLFLLLLIPIFLKWNNILFWIFGYSIIIIPILFYFQRSIVFCLKFIFLFYIIDLIHPIFSYKFLGSLGEIVWIINRKLFSIPFFVLAFFLYNKKLIVEHKLDILDDKVNYNQKIPIERETIEKLLIKYNVQGYISEVCVGAFVIRFFLNLDSSIRLSRFKGLSTEFSEELKLKVLNNTNLNEIFIDIEKTEKTPIHLKNILHISQPNQFPLETADGKIILFNSLRNIYFKVSHSVVLSILSLIIMTRMNVQVSILESPSLEFLEFSKQFSLIDENINSFIMDLNEEIDLRYSKRENYKQHIIVIFHSKNFNKQNLEYLIKYGEKVGIFVYLIEEKTFEDLFKNKILSFSSLKESIELIKKPDLFYLTHDHDCLFVNDNTQLRVSIPITNSSEIHRIANFMNKYNYQ